MRRGFKSWCERTSQDYRNALGLTVDDPLDPLALANHLGVTVWRPEDVPSLSAESLSQLLAKDSDSWSAVTIRIEETILTILNSAHALTRQRNSLAHELSHLMLAHEPGRIDVSKNGYLLLNSFEKEQEEEADWLSGTLLVPRNGLLKMFQTAPDPPYIANHFGVSLQLLQWRLRMTGVPAQLRRMKTV